MSEIDPDELRATYHNQNLSVSQVCNHLDIARSELHSLRKEHNIRARNESPDVDFDQLRQLLTTPGISNGSIANTLGISEDALRRLKRKHDLPHNVFDTSKPEVEARHDISIWDFPWEVDYDPEADFYIYILDCRRPPGCNQDPGALDKYVGRTENLRNRIKDHRRENGAFKSYEKSDGATALTHRSEVDYSIERVQGSSEYGSDAHAKWREREVFCQVARSSDSMVLGGK